MSRLHRKLTNKNACIDFLRNYIAQPTPTVQPKQHPVDYKRDVKFRIHISLKQTFGMVKVF